MKHILLLICTLNLWGYALAQKGNQIACYKNGPPIGLAFVDIQPRPGELFFAFQIDQNPAELISQGLLWFPDDPKGFFMGYLVNNTDTLFKAKRQDESLLIIQEALDPQGNWAPIEYWVYTGCGNSFYNPLRLGPGQCILIPIRKYTGSYKTQLRLKFKFDGGIMYSEPFEGSIHKTQFQQTYDPLFADLVSYFEDQ